MGQDLRGGLLVASGAHPLSRLSLASCVAAIFITRTIETGGSKWMHAPARRFTSEKNRTNLGTCVTIPVFTLPSLPSPHRTHELSMQYTGETSCKHAGRYISQIHVGDVVVYCRFGVRQMNKSLPVKRKSLDALFRPPTSESFSCHAAVQEEKECHCRSVGRIARYMANIAAVCGR